ncbi:MAG: hypothetical protein K6T68_08665 [Alicyclobacillus shizuokensis]|nr:hypothetical protein [Alicyclobacillus shizuokensis]
MVHATEGQVGPPRWVEQEATLQTYKADLLALLALRFGLVPGEVSNVILAMDDPGQLERLIWMAAHAPTWAAFIEELKTPNGGRKFTHQHAPSGMESVRVDGSNPPARSQR